MSGLVLAAIIAAVFFAAGVVLGVTMIVSLSVTGRRRARQDAWPQHGGPNDRPRLPGSDPDPGDDPDADYPDGPPPWPDSGYRT